MLYTALVFSGILLLVANFAARSAPNRVRWGTFLGIGLLVSICPAGIFLSLVTILLFIMLVLALGLWPILRKRMRLFLPLSLACAALAYGVGIWMAFANVARYDRMREQYPYESMADRVPPPDDSARGTPLDGQGSERLLNLEKEVKGEQWYPRAWMLAALHEHTINEFTNSPGFGVTRSFDIYEPALRPRPRGEIPLQPSQYAPTFVFAGLATLATNDQAQLFEFHQRSMLDFLNPVGFGFFKDREHVAGFQSHGFSVLPEPASTWKVQRIELVGLLLKPRPVVYMTAELPVMDKARTAPTRSLDRFETSALARIRKGSDLLGAQSEDYLRLLGAIRCTNQCVECHACQRGDLLGAFSYTLKRADSKP